MVEKDFMDIRELIKEPIASKQKQKGFVPSQIPAKTDVGTTNLTKPEGTAPDASVTDELSAPMVAEYLKFLAEHDISEPQIFQVLDSLITNQTVQWSFTFLGKVPVVFCVRPAWVNSLILERMQENPPKTYAAFNDLVNTYNLAGSLAKYGDTTFSVTDEDSFDQVRLYVQRMPFVIKGNLIRQLAIFDRVVAVATSDWAIENFQKPSSGE